MENTLQKMIAYFRDELPPEEEKIMEERIQGDAEFAWVMERLHQKLFVEDGTEEELEEMQRVLVEQAVKLSKGKATPEGKIRQFPPTWSYFIAAAAIILLFVWVIRPHDTLTPDEISRKFLSHHDIQLSTRGSNSDFQKKVDQAVLTYQTANQQGYQQAVDLLADILSQKDSISSQYDLAELGLAYGNSLIMVGLLDEAIPVLQSILDDGAREQSTPAKWLMAHAYLRMERTAEAKSLLQDVSNQSGPYQQRAKEILDELR